MLEPIKPISALLFLIFTIVFFPWNSYADDSDFSEMEMSFKNFITCELTRTEATNPFKGKPFTITMIDLFDVQFESDIQIVTGAVQCFVDDQYITLYAAVGITKLLEKEQVSYYTIRDQDFSILATELIRFPYKERCKWTQYWVDID
jgi:hypothetical protein